MIDPKLVARFMRKVKIDGPTPSHHPDLGACHVWVGSTDDDGYGRFWIDGKSYLSHRVAFFIAEGRWPEPQGLHRCDNPSCVRRDHLFEGTRADNMRDKVSKGRAFTGDHRGEQNARAKLTADDVLAIRAAATAREPQSSIARRFMITVPYVSQIVRRETWKHI